MKNLLLIICTAIMLAGCSIPQDRSPAPIDHGLRTLEMASCEKRDVGLLGCFFSVEDPIGTLSIPLYHKGEYVITSKQCDYNLNKRYDKKRELTLSYAELLKNKPHDDMNCLYDVKVFVDGFDKGFRGSFLLVRKGYKSTTFSYRKKNYTGIGGIQLREGNPTDHKITFPDIAYPGLMFWEGCSSDGELKFEESPSIDFKDLFSSAYQSENDSCILTIGVIPDDNQIPVEYGKYQINFYGNPVVTLAYPSISYKKEKLKVRFDKLVAAYYVAGKQKIRRTNSSRKVTRTVKRDQVVWLKWATSNGRYNLIKIQNGEVIWTSCLR